MRIMPPPTRSEAGADADADADAEEDKEEEGEEEGEGEGGDRAGFAPRFMAVKCQPMWWRHRSQHAIVQAYPGNHECCVRPKGAPGKAVGAKATAWVGLENSAMIDEWGAECGTRGDGDAILGRRRQGHVGGWLTFRRAETETAGKYHKTPQNSPR